MNTKKFFMRLLILLLPLVLSCSGGYFLTVRAFPTAQKVSIEGDFCTKEATSLTAPVRILFIVDSSGSMADTDGSYKRVDGVENVVNQYYQYENVSFGIAMYSSSITNLTSGFTRDSSVLDAAYSSLRTANGYTYTKEAVDSARAMIENDTAQIEDPGLLARTTYIVVLFSDGMPYYASSSINDWSQIKSDLLASVDSIMQLKSSKGLLKVQVHSAFLGTESGFDPGGLYERYGFSESEAFDEAIILMQDIATHGSGTFTHFTQADQINFLDIVSGTLKIPYSIDNLIASNYNLRIIVRNSFGYTDIVEVPDSDGDGLADVEETTLGTDPTKKDTDGDGIGDYVEILKGMDPLHQDYTCTNPSQDLDADGLTDCEEVLLGTNRLIPDTDEDGIPDGIEVINGLNPLDPDDAALDSDGDGRNNFDEIKMHTNPQLDDHVLFDTSSYTYTVNLTSTTPDGFACYHIKVGNIGVIKTEVLSGSDHPSNRVLMNIIQKSTAPDTTDRLISFGNLDLDTSKVENLAGKVYPLESIVFKNY